MKLASRLIHVSVVVSTTSAREMPSMPTLVLDAERGHPVRLLPELEARDVDVEARDQRAATATKARRAVTNAAQRMGASIAGDEGDDDGADERR